MSYEQRVLRSLLLVVIVAICFPRSSNGQSLENKKIDTTAAGLAIYFEPNLGQFPPPARFVSRTGNMELNIRPQGFDLTLGTHPNTRQTLALDFVGASMDAYLSPSDQKRGQSNYIRGSDSAKWVTHVPNFGRVTYTALYPGIDAVFYGNRQRLEHDFLIAPGANYREIRMRISGSNTISMDPAGNLIISSSDGKLVFHSPKIYQSIRGRRQDRHGRFVLLSRNEIGFAVDTYDKTKPLVIDPVLDYQTFISSSYFLTTGVGTDVAGNTFVSGIVTSSGALRVLKLNPLGTDLIYNTEIGDNCEPYGGIAIDANGNALVAITTISTNLANFPLKNSVPFGTQGNGAWYGYVVSLSSDGSSLNYASLLGGGTPQYQSPSTIVRGIAKDVDGNAYISGYTDSPVFPVTPGALNNNNVVPDYFTGSVTYVTKFLPDGNLGYSALIGGHGGVLAIAADMTGAYVTGTGSAGWPITAGAYQSTIPGSSNPLTAPFITKISPDGSSLLYSTFLGSDAQSNTIAVNASGEAFVAGGYAPATFPTTSNAYQKNLVAPRTAGAFLSKLSSTGNQLLYSSFFYGNVNSPYSNTMITAVELQSTGNIWLAGTTQDTSIRLVHPIQTVPSTSGLSLPGFLAEFDSTGSTLNFSSYVGDPSLGAQSLNIALDPQGKLHVAGITGYELYTSPNAYIGANAPPPPNSDVLYGFVEVIDPNIAAPSACFSPLSGLNFGAVQVGTSLAKDLTITNCSDVLLTPTGAQLSNPAFTIPTGSNQCLKTFAANASCSLSVTFAPGAVDSYSGVITVTSNAGMPTVLPLQGAGFIPTPPQAQVLITSLTYDPQFVGKTSAAQSFSVVNVGQQPLILDMAHATISPGFAFTQTNCSNPIPGGFNCAFHVTFAPQSEGDIKGTLNFSTNDPLNPTFSISLEGTGLTSFPVPTITGSSPPSVLLGSGSITVQIVGFNFFPSSVVLVNGVAQPTTYQEFSVLSATLDSSFFAALGEFRVTVFNPAPGGGESSPSYITVYQTVQLGASDMVYEPVSKMLYAAIPAGAAANANSIIPLDPATAKTGTPISVGHDPEALAVSDDGQYLYVALYGDHTIQRINLKNNAVDRTFSLPDPYVFPYQLKVVPGAPTSLVASLAVGGPAGIAFFNDNGLVNWLSQDARGGPVQVTSFAFAGSPPVIYSMPFSSGANFFNSFTVDSLGIHLSSNSPAGGTKPPSGSAVFSDGTLLYTNTGEIWDPSTQSMLATYNPSLYSASGVLPEAGHGAMYFLDPYANYNQTFSGAVEAYDQHTHGLSRGVAFNPFYGSDLIDLSRWGSDGFAFLFSTVQQVLGSGQAVLFHSSVARGTSPDFTIGANPPLLQPLTISVSGANSAPVTLAITALNGYSGTIAFTPSSCTVTPVGSHATCSFSSPGAVTGGGAIQLTLTTSSSQSSPHMPPIDLRWLEILFLVAVFAGMMCVTLAGPVNRRRFAVGLGLFVFLAILSTFNGCGANGLTGGGSSGGTNGGGNGGPGTPPAVTYFVTVTASPGAGQPSHAILIPFVIK